MNLEDKYNTNRFIANLLHFKLNLFVVFLFLADNQIGFRGIG